MVPKGNYALIGGDPGQTGSTQMQEGYHSVLDALAEKGDIKIVLDQFSSGWKTEAAQAHAENALTQNDNKIDAFLVSYDGMSVGVLQAIDGAGIAPGSIPVTGQDMELAAAQAIVEGRMFGSVWPAPDEMAVAGANAAIAMAQCKDIGATDKINNKAADIPWVKTPIYLVSGKEMPEFACSHQALARHRRGLQERAGQEADVPVSRPAAEVAACTATVAPDSHHVARCGWRRERPSFRRAASPRNFRAWSRSTISASRSRRARSSPCSARTARANRPSSRSSPACTGGYRGEIALDGKPYQPASVAEAEAAGVALVPQEVNVAPDLTVAENMYLNAEPTRFGFLDRPLMLARARRVLEDFGLAVDPAAAMGSLDLSTQQLVIIARALSKNARLLILDEPTAALTEAEARRLFERMRALTARGVAIIFVIAPPGGSVRGLGPHRHHARRPHLRQLCHRRCLARHRGGADGRRRPHADRARRPSSPARSRSRPRI